MRANIAVCAFQFERLLAGQKVITSDIELDKMLDMYGDKASPLMENPKVHEIQSIPNPNRIGIYDQYIAWIE